MNNSASQRCNDKRSVMQTPMGVLNVDYVPNTFSPSPPPKTALQKFCRDPGPCKHFIKIPDEVINIENYDGNSRIFDGGTMRTPENFMLKMPSAISNSPEIQCLGERRFDEKIRHMCH